MQQPRNAASRPPGAGILLHICCASCATYVVQVLRARFAVVGYFYNPNIHPRKEYDLRREDTERYARDIELPLHVGRYDVQRWFSLVRGHEQDPEGGERCAICYRARLESTAAYANQLGLEYFTTTLSVSPHKNAPLINRIGAEIGESYGATFYAADFKKHDGFRISCQMSRQLGLYRQNYCGCIFSKRQRESRVQPPASDHRQIHPPSI